MITKNNQIQKLIKKMILAKINKITIKFKFKMLGQEEDK